MPTGVRAVFVATNQRKENYMSQFALPIAELKPALAGLGKVIAKRCTLPVLGNIKIERTKDGWIALTGVLSAQTLSGVALGAHPRGHAPSANSTHSQNSDDAQASARTEGILPEM